MNVFWIYSRPKVDLLNWGKRQKGEKAKMTIRIEKIAAIILFIGSLTVGATFAQKKDGLKPTVGTATKFDISPPFSSIRPVTPQKQPEKGEDDRGTPGPINNTKHDPDPVVQRTEGSGIFNQNPLIPPTTASFDGMINTTGVNPPDTIGDVGTNHYVQMVNSRLQIFNKAGASVLGPININTLWTGFGGKCDTDNAGDPVVLHDQLADRWLITQFTSPLSGAPYFNCVALSQTNDPTGAYYRYAFSTGTFFPDYPKYGVWSDGYYISTREFGDAGGYQIGAYALERDQMLLGNPNPQVVSFLITTPAYQLGDGILPADLDGNTLPPAGSPQYFVGSMDSGFPNYAAPADALNLFKFQVNWVTPANSTFAFSNQINVADFDSVFPCTPSSRTCIPQPGTSAKIDILSYRQRPLHRLAYRNFGTHESLVTSQSVEATAGVAGMRWYEVRSPNSSPSIFQQGTYSPDSVNRWMGSIAMDRKGNMLLGYSVSDAATVFPGIRFTGRLVADPLGTMPQGEGTMISGAGSQTTTNNRWGDYSSMNVDPADDCTFWYTNEYYSTTSLSSWRTRISSVTFPGCVAPTAAGVQVAGRVRSSDGRGLNGVIVSLQATDDGQTRNARTNSFGYYRFSDVPAGGNYIVTATAKAYEFLPKVIFLGEDLADLDFVSTTLSQKREEKPSQKKR